MLSTSTLLTLILPASAAVHESLAALPVGWQQSSHSVPDGHHMQMQVALQYQNVDTLEAKLKAVSDPSSPDYGKYLGVDDVNKAFAPASSSEGKVKSWLQKSGCSNIMSDGKIVSFTATVAQANKMLDTKFGLYTNGETTKLRTMGYSVPDELGDAVDVVTPTTYFGDTKAYAAIPESATSDFLAIEKRDQPTIDLSCETEINYQINATYNRTYTVLTPSCLQMLYNIEGYDADPSSGSNIAFGNFLNQTPSYRDLALFEKMFNIPSQNFTVVDLINGGVNDQDPATEQDGEANLDVQNIVSLVDGLPIYTWITGGSPPFIPTLLQPNASENQNEPYLQYYQYLLAQPDSKLPWVITNSYGDEENGVPERYAKRVCNMIGMLGLRGRTVLESSGDAGVGASCRAGLDGKPEFTPTFPGSCPYLTAVGGTQSVNPEIAWNASQGGFSNYFDRAWYQKNAVETYLDKYISASTKEYYSSNGYVNFSGRAFPDVAAHSLWPDYVTVINGTASPNGGTSAASPVVASIIALLNDARFRAGLPAMGFINPWLYGQGTAGLNDITGGGAVGCSGVNLQTGQPVPNGGVIPYASWNATVGWDPVTGLGTPDFMAMKDIALENGASGGYGGGWGWGKGGGWRKGGHGGKGGH